MFLKTLTIEDNGRIIRDIHFKKGLNLIIDETATKSGAESGNNVGKTTVLRLIDFCFGSNGENVYKDTEFKDKTNTIIEKFLKENNIVISLSLVSDLDKSLTPEIIVRKNFLKRKNKIQEINGTYYNDTDFDLKLKELIFHSDAKKPTFRQIISKNIRYEKFRLENTLKVLHYSTTFEQYEALYFFWLGIETDAANRKQKLYTEKSTEESILKRLKRTGSLSEIHQALSIIDRDINELNVRKGTFNINEAYESDLNSLNDVRSKINSLATRLNQYALRKEIILESKKELEKEYANIDIELLEEIYKSAQGFVPSLHAKFTEMVAFHNNMLREKIKFVTNEIPSLDLALAATQSELKNARLTEHELSIKLKKSGAIEELEELITKLNQKFEQKGMYEEQQKQWEQTNEKLKKIDDELTQINSGIASQDTILESRISAFNEYFSKISEKLYDEQFILSQDKNERAYELKISSIGGNLGTGKKKGQIAAFDIAYIQFCDENDIPCLHFVLHDQVETIHDNQLTIIADLVATANVQYIVPVLRDKLPPDLNPEVYKVVSLSEDEKLFKI